MDYHEADLVGESVGHIRLISVLGQGGMGTVYEGVDETLRRRVAVKVIRGDQRLNPRSKARFLREGRILSQMNHRNICAVHDFIEGEDSDFLVLELVPGVNLRTAMAQGLPEEQRLSIARQLLEVLVAVHATGVIHRDLKPANIMVKPDGTIVVLDFGLARSADEDAPTMPVPAGPDPVELEDRPEETLPYLECDPSFQVKTKHGVVIGTAGYLSPEQARAEPATAASDMYAAGLILQELFSASSPFEEGTGAQGLILKAALGETVPVTGVGSDLKRLIERLESFAPGARPSSVDALAELQRIIDAPRQRRRKVVVATVWIALAALTVGMTIQSVRASREAARASREAETAREASNFLVNLFEESNPERARGASLSAEEILKRGAERIDEKLEDQPLTRARLLMTIGRVYNKMGLYPEAVPFVDEALEIRARELGDESAVVAQTLFLLGTYKGSAGDLPGAERDLEHALELRKRIYGPDHVRVADTLTNLAVQQTSAGRFPDAESTLKQALAINETVLGPGHVSVAKNLATLGILAAMQGHPDEAGMRFERALAVLEATLGADHPSVLRMRANLAVNLMERGKLEEAEPLFRKNAEIQGRVLGEEHPDLGKSYQNFANLLVKLDRLDEAEDSYLRSLEIARGSLGDEHPEVGLCLSNLGELYLTQGRLQEAEVTCLEALAIREKALGPDHPGVGFTLFNLAKISRRHGRIPEADERYARSLAIFRAAFSPDHPQSIDAAKEYADFLREQGRDAEAAALEGSRSNQPLSP